MLNLCQKEQSFNGCKTVSSKYNPGTSTSFDLGNGFDSEYLMDLLSMQAPLNRFLEAIHTTIKRVKSSRVPLSHISSSSTQVAPEYVALQGVSYPNRQD